MALLCTCTSTRLPSVILVQQQETHRNDTEFIQNILTFINDSLLESVPKITNFKTIQEKYALRSKILCGCGRQVRVQVHQSPAHVNTTLVQVQE